MFKSSIPLLLFVSLGLLSGCGGGGAPGSACGGASTSVVVPASASNFVSTGQSVSLFLKDAPADNVLALRLDLCSAALQDASGQQPTNSATSPAPGPQDVELRHLELSPTMVGRKSGLPATEYQSVTLHFANPRLMVLGQNGSVQSVSLSSHPAARLTSSMVKVPLSLNLPSAGNLGLMLDFDIQDSVRTDSSGNYLINPVVTASVLDGTGSTGTLEDTQAKIVSSNAEGADVMLLKSGQLIRLKTGPATLFDAQIANSSGLQPARYVALDAELQPDGTFLATYIGSLPSDLSLDHHGLVTSTRQLSPTSSAFQMVDWN